MDQEDNARRALKAALERIALALDGVPKETRMAQPDGTTRFLRPQPGAARMYPETDIPLMKVDPKLLDEAKAYAPPDPSEKLRYYVESLGLNKQLAQQVLDDENMLLIEELMEEYKDRLEASYIASVMTGTLRALKREGAPIENLQPHHFQEAFRLLARGDISKEGLEKLLELMSNSPSEDPEKLAEKHGLKVLPREQVEAIIDQVIQELRPQIEAKGPKAMGLVMGRAMAKLRGRAPGKLVSEIVKKKLEALNKGQ